MSPRPSFLYFVGCDHLGKAVAGPLCSWPLLFAWAGRYFDLFDTTSLANVKAATITTSLQKTMIIDSSASLELIPDACVVAPSCLLSILPLTINLRSITARLQQRHTVRKWEVQQHSDENMTRIHDFHNFRIDSLSRFFPMSVRRSWYTHRCIDSSRLSVYFTTFTASSFSVFIRTR